MYRIKFMRAIWLNAWSIPRSHLRCEIAPPEPKTGETTRDDEPLVAMLLGDFHESVRQLSRRRLRFSTFQVLRERIHHRNCQSTEMTISGARATASFARTLQGMSALCRMFALSPMAVLVLTGTR
jgi:hypothetical protein